MRPVAQPRTHSRRTRRTGPRATQPSTTPSTMRTTGPQGTLGGTAAPARKPGAAASAIKMGPQYYLWILVVIELAMVGALRKFFRKVHGG